MEDNGKQRFPREAPRDMGEMVAHMGGECVAFNLRKTARAITQVYDDCLRGCGLKVNQFSLMASILAGQPVKVGQLARWAGMDRTTVTRNLGPLVRDGLVEITPGDDKRERLVTLTAAGQRRLRESYPHWREAQTKLVETLGREEWDRLKQGLQHLRRSVR